VSSMGRVLFDAGHAPARWASASWAGGRRFSFSSLPGHVPGKINRVRAELVARRPFLLEGWPAHRRFPRGHPAVDPQGRGRRWGFCLGGTPGHSPLCQGRHVLIVVRPGKSGRGSRVKLAQRLGEHSDSAGDWKGQPSGCCLAIPVAGTQQKPEHKRIWSPTLMGDTVASFALLPWHTTHGRSAGYRGHCGPLFSGR